MDRVAVKEYGPVHVSGDHVTIHQGDQYGWKTKGDIERDAVLDMRKALRYENMDARRAQLQSHDAVSCEWIWSTQLREWLSSESPLFWVHGKPASGKSTLMNWIVSQSHRVQSLLPRGNEWLISTFYFDFRAGVELSNSELGMLRTLLFQLSRDFRIGEALRQRHPDRLDKSWMSEKKALIEAIVDSLSSTSIRLCAFIDGLDEYEGRSRNLIDCLLELQTASKAKLVLSSRPGTVLQYRLRDFPSIQLQDHNLATIRKYIDTSLASLRGEELDDLQAVIQQVLSHSNGVILWTVFIVDELVEARICGATLSELELLISTYPRELEGVYDRILNRLDNDRAQEAQLALRILLIHDGQMSTHHFLGFWTVLEEQLSLNKTSTTPMSAAQIITRTHSILEGLLEFHHRGRCPTNNYFSKAVSSEPCTDTLDAKLKEHCTPYACTVRFVHKTLATHLELRFSWLSTITLIFSSLPDAAQEFDWHLYILTARSIADDALATAVQDARNCTGPVSTSRTKFIIQHLPRLQERLYLVTLVREIVQPFLMGVDKLNYGIPGTRFHVERNRRTRRGSEHEEVMTWTPPARDTVELVRCLIMALHGPICELCPLANSGEVAVSWRHVYILQCHLRWSELELALSHDDVQGLSPEVRDQMVRFCVRDAQYTMNLSDSDKARKLFYSYLASLGTRRWNQTSTARPASETLVHFSRLLPTDSLVSQS